MGWMPAAFSLATASLSSVKLVGVAVMPAFGLVDYCRVSCDVGLDWDDVAAWLERSWRSVAPAAVARTLPASSGN